MNCPHRDRILVVALAFAGLAGVRVDAAWGELSEDDEREIQATAERFVDAWLVDAPDTVMSTLAEEAVLMPHHGVEPVIGTADIRAFWWPPDAAVKVLVFDQSYDEIDGDGDLAYVRGRFELAFEFESAGEVRRMSYEGNYLMLLRRDDDGEWRISHRIWNDPVPQAE